MINSKAKWIWVDGDNTPNDWVIFRRKFMLAAIPKPAELRIACESCYTLYVNGKLAVLDGGYPKGVSSHGYFDTVNIAKHLKKGDNVITVYAWYHGNSGRDDKGAGKAGLLVDCDTIDIMSDSNYLVMRNPANLKNTDGPQPTGGYGGYNVVYDACKHIDNLNDVIYIHSDFKEAFEIGEYGEDGLAPYGALASRPVPMFWLGNPASAKMSKKSNAAGGFEYTVKLPYHMHFAPVFNCIAMGNEKVDIRTDRYETNGPIGSEDKITTSRRIEYTCKMGPQEFESHTWLCGEKIIITAPATVKFKSVEYIESAYDTSVVGKFGCKGDDRLETLTEKCERTLLSNMRHNIMDCADRERLSRADSASFAAPLIFYHLDEDAVPAVKKSVDDFFALLLKSGEGPGAARLAALSEYGLLAYYYKYTGDKQAIKPHINDIAEYLKAYKRDESGLVSGCKYDDGLYNADAKVLINAMYYSALNNFKFLLEQIGDKTHDVFIKETGKCVEKAFEGYWKGRGYSSCKCTDCCGGDCFDDRANAWAVISGLAKENQYSVIARLLTSAAHGGPYMEGFVLEALCRCGAYEAAYRRMMNRYSGQIDGGDSTLWEDFGILGAKNCARSIAPLTICYKYFAGIDLSLYNETVTVTPCAAVFNDELNFSVSTPNGAITGKYSKDDDNNITINVHNHTKYNVDLVLSSTALGKKTVDKVVNVAKHIKLTV